jgi:uncharacterized protein with FMN-binding domain
MRRALIILTATVAGTGAVVAYNPQPALTGPVAERALPAIAQTTGTGDGVFLGSAISNPYGAVQVQIAMAGGKVVDVRAVRLPDGDGTSQAINRDAAPRLKQQALVAQDATVDGVSGATYTSDGYRQSLQAALDRAGSVTPSGQSA